MDRFDLSGRTALVTGGSRGIGRAAAQALAEAGADVVVASRNEASCRRAADEIAAATGRRAFAHASDSNQPNRSAGLPAARSYAWRSACAEGIEHAASPTPGKFPGSQNSAIQPRSTRGSPTDQISQSITTFTFPPAWVPQLNASMVYGSDPWTAETALIQVYRACI